MPMSFEVVQTVILVDGLIAIPHNAEAEFRYQRRAEDVRIVEPGL